MLKLYKELEKHNQKKMNIIYCFISKGFICHINEKRGIYPL